MIYELNIHIERCKTLEDVSRLMRLNKVDIVFFAETHGMLDELKIQDKIISVLKPTCYLYELLEEERIISDKDFIEFLKKKNSERFSIISSFGELKQTVQLARKYNLHVIGCDIRNMCRKKKDFLKETNAEEEKIMLKREERQNKVIEEASGKYGSPIFVSIGAFHLRKDSLVLRKVKHRYVLVQPLINGKRLEDLDENFDINNIKGVSYMMEADRDGNQTKN